MRITPTTPFEELPEYLTVSEVCTWLRLSKNTVYAAVRGGRIESRCFAQRKTLVPKRALKGLHEAARSEQPESQEAAK